MIQQFDYAHNVDRHNTESYQIGIDAKNVNFITTLLTSRLYSNPLEAFFREIVSNAYDACVEAQTEDSTIITLSKNGDMIDITIRDFGIGISEQRFNEIFLFLGSSTKRESNDYIGQLGSKKNIVLYND